MIRQVITALTLTSLAACSRPSPELQVVVDAAAALGGRERILAVRSIAMEGQGMNGAAGGSVTPDTPPNQWAITDYSRTIDLANGRTRLSQTRTAQFPFALATVARQDQRLDGDVAFNVIAGAEGQPSRTVRAAAAVATERRTDVLSHPLALLRAALDPAAKVSNLRTEDGQSHVDITTAQGDVLTLAIDPTTKLPTHIARRSSDPNWGDIVIETTLSDYQDVSGLKVPTRLVTRQDQWTLADIRISRTTLDADTSALIADDSVKSAPLPTPPAINVTSEQIGKGIWWLAGGSHHSVLFEFDDHTTLFEVPLDDARTQAVIARARAIVPGKPLTHAIVSHHHLDHAGGFRAAVAEGLTIITQRGNESFLREIATRPHTLAPDALEMAKKEPKFEWVDDELVLKDRTNEIILYKANGNIHTGLLIYGWVPRDRMLVQADFYDAGWLQHPWADNFIENVKARKLNVDRDVPIHGPIQKWADVVATIESKRSTKTN